VRLLPLSHLPLSSIIEVSTADKVADAAFAPGQEGEAMPQFINLTPHAIRFLNKDDATIFELPPAKPAARIRFDRWNFGEREVAPGVSVPIRILKRGAIENLPAPETGKAYIVSRLVAEEVINLGIKRTDLFVPGGLVRNYYETPGHVPCRFLTQYAGASFTPHSM